MRRLKDLSIQEIEKAITQSKTFADAIEMLGFNKKGSITRKTLRKILKEHNISTEHFYFYKSKHDWSKEYLQDIIKLSYSMTDILNQIGIPARSGNFSTLQRKIKKYNINISHFDPQKSSANLARKTNGPVQLQDVLNGLRPNYSTINLKQRLYNEGIKEKKCEHCKNTQWMGTEIPLELNHKDGNNKNHKLENLEILCSNCHAQTPTYRSKNKNFRIRTYERVKKVKIKKLVGRQRKVLRPTKEKLYELLWTMPTTKIGEQFNVTDNCIARWAKEYNLQKPGRGYWSKIRSVD